MGGTDGFTLIMRDDVDPATAPNKPPLGVSEFDPDRSVVAGLLPAARR